MSNKIRVLTNISASQNIIVSGSSIISGSKSLATTSSFNNVAVSTSSGGFYDMDIAIHGLDTGITTLKNNIKTAYNSIRAVLTGTLDSSGNKKINLTSTIPSGSVYFTTASLTSVGASVLTDTESNNIYKNDLISLQLFNSASCLWAEIDAPAANNDYYRLILVNHGSFPINSGNTSAGGGSGGGSGGGGGSDLYLLVPYILNPTGNLQTTLNNPSSRQGFYGYPDYNGNIKFTLNNFSSSVDTGGITFYIIPNIYSGSLTYDPTTNLINTAGVGRVITLQGPNLANLTLSGDNIGGVEGGGYPTDYTRNINNNNTNTNLHVHDGVVDITIPVGTGSTVYVDTAGPVAYDINWTGGAYYNPSAEQMTFVQTNIGGYYVPPINDFNTNYKDTYISASGTPTRIYIPLINSDGTYKPTLTPVSVETPTGLYVRINSYIHSLRFFSAYNPTANINDFSPGTNAFGEPTVPGVGFNEYGNFDSMSFINYMSVYSFDDSMYYTPQSPYPIVIFVPSRSGVAKLWIVSYPQTNPPPEPGYTNGIGNIEVWTA
jgi:hypothetical protein